MDLINKQFIFETNDTVAQCHAATVVVLNGNIVASAWFAGSAEGKPDVSIWFTRCVDGIWEAPIMLTANDGIPHWNPVLFSPDGETLTLFYKVGDKIPDWKTYVMQSYDGGKSWTEANELVLNDTSGGRGPVKNKPIMLADGKILAPASTEQGINAVCLFAIAKDLDLFSLHCGQAVTATFTLCFVQIKGLFTVAILAIMAKAGHNAIL